MGVFFSDNHMLRHTFCSLLTTRPLFYHCSVSYATVDALRDELVPGSLRRVVGKLIGRQFPIHRPDVAAVVHESAINLNTLETSKEESCYTHIVGSVPMPAELVNRVSA